MYRTEETQESSLWTSSRTLGRERSLNSRLETIEPEDEGMMISFREKKKDEGRYPQCLIMFGYSGHAEEATRGGQERRMDRCMDGLKCVHH